MVGLLPCQENSPAQADTRRITQRIVEIAGAAFAQQVTGDDRHRLRRVLQRRGELGQGQLGGTIAFAGDGDMLGHTGFAGL